MDGRGCWARCPHRGPPARGPQQWGHSSLEVAAYFFCLKNPVCCSFWKLESAPSSKQWAGEIGVQTVHNWSVCVWKHNKRPLNWFLSGSPSLVTVHGVSLFGRRLAQKWGGKGHCDALGRAILLRVEPEILPAALVLKYLFFHEMSVDNRWIFNPL